MNENQQQELETFLKQLVDNILNNDIKYGRELKSVCESNIDKKTCNSVCEKKVKDYLNDIDSRYGEIANFIKQNCGVKSRTIDNSIPPCFLLNNYICFLEFLKDTKDRTLTIKEIMEKTKN